MGLSDAFIKDYMWILIVLVLIFTVFIGYTLNKNIDPSEIEEEEDEFNTNNTDEDK